MAQPRREAKTDLQPKRDFRDTLPYTRSVYHRIAGAATPRARKTER
jgi:hypothetical protein